MTEKKIESKFYDRNYFKVRYVDNLQPYYRLVNLLEEMDLHKDDIVFDFGCGNGLLLKAFTEYGISVKQYSGIDFSVSAIEMAKEEASTRPDPGFPIQFENSDILAFCSSHPGQANADFAMDFSEHVADQEWLDFLQSIYRSLDKNNGRLFLHTPNAEFLLEIMKRHNFILKQFPDHIAVRSGKENANLLKQAGFRKVTVRHIAHYIPLLKPLHLMRWLPGLGKFFKARLFIIAEK